jgi:peptide/nickel transport system ATP-binding protein
MLDKIVSSSTMLEVRDLRVSFRTADGFVRILNDVSFSVGSGEILSIVGESGSGKSMTSLAIMRLINDPNAVVSGSILYKGRDLLSVSPKQMRSLRGNEIAMIFQDPMTAMTPVHTIGWQITEQVLAHQDLTRKQAKRHATDLLAKMGIPNPASAYDRYPHQLSGGMRQRAMIAMAISCNPSLLIADEPTTALDVTVQAQILELLQSLRQDFGSAILLITHDMGVVSTVSDKVLVMYSGNVVEYGAKSQVLSHPSHPYTLGLMRSIPPMVGERPHRLPSIPGNPPLPSARPTGCAFRPRCEFQYAQCSEQPPLFACGDQHAACFLAQTGHPNWALERETRMRSTSP